MVKGNKKLVEEARPSQDGRDGEPVRKPSRYSDNPVALYGERYSREEVADIHLACFDASDLMGLAFGEVAYSNCCGNVTPKQAVGGARVYDSQQGARRLCVPVANSHP